jgi:hypothetical protein
VFPTITGARLKHGADMNDAVICRLKGRGVGTAMRGKGVHPMPPGTDIIQITDFDDKILARSSAVINIPHHSAEAVTAAT